MCVPSTVCTVTTSVAVDHEMIDGHRQIENAVKIRAQVFLGVAAFVPAGRRVPR
jgi:hypothetical protein